MSTHHVITFVTALGCCLCGSLSAHAANTATVLQFGGTNASSVVQTGFTSNTSSVLQFGSFNQASTVQAGPVAPSVTNNSIIGQGGGINAASTAQVGGSNFSLIGQIGSSNWASAGQLGILNGIQIIQQSP